MHTAAKVTLGFSGVLIVIGVISALVGGVSLGETIGNSSPDNEDWSGELMWEGTTPTSYTGEFDWTHIYNVWVEDGGSVQVEVIGGDSENLFISCEELDDCSIFDEEGAIPGYEYIGEISVMDSGTWQVEFTVEDGDTVDVMIRDDPSFGGFLGILGGGVACCFGILFLIVGGIMAATMKDKSKVNMSPIVPVGTGDVVIVPDKPAMGSEAPFSADDESEPESDLEWWNAPESEEST